MINVIVTVKLRVLSKIRKVYKVKFELNHFEMTSPFPHLKIFLFEIKGKYFMANGRMFMFASKYMGKGKQNAKRQKAVSSKSEPA